jgi:hypothetical protein
LKKETASLIEILTVIQTHTGSNRKKNGMGNGPMSQRNKVIAYFIGIFISVGFPAFGGGIIERVPFREHPWREHPWREHPGMGVGDLLSPPINRDDFRDRFRHSWLDPAYDWTPRTGLPIVIDPIISLAE